MSATLITELPASTPTKRLIDLLQEICGIYRLRLAFRGGLIALSASVKSPSRLSVGRDVLIQKGSIIHCGGKAWSGFLGHVHLSDGVRVGPYCVIYGAGGVNLGRHVHLGPGVKIMSQSGRHDQARLSRNPNFKFGRVNVGEGTWIGAGAVLLGDTHIGRCVSIAPNSVVSGTVPDFAVVAGSPARIVFMNTPIGDC